MNFYNIPLMDDNMEREDIDSLIKFLSQDPLPRLTNGKKCMEFEEEWSKYLGVKYSLFVNSGSAANQLTMLGLREYFKGKIFNTSNVICPPLTWVSDIAAVLQNRMIPNFVDINLKNLSFDIEKFKKSITKKTKIVFLTHVLGLNGLTDEILQICKDRDLILIEDCCESHDATFKNKKVGTFGFASNFSFYHGHSMTSIEGGMICTNDEKFYQLLRCLRSHSMLRESTDIIWKEEMIKKYNYLNKDFIFLAPAYNFRSTEINAVIGLNQLKRLAGNSLKRTDNFNYFISKLDKNKYHTDLEMEGQCNYGLIVILKNGNFEKRDVVEKVLTENRIEFRRGLSGGGNQLKQPYLKDIIKHHNKSFKNVNYIHDFSWYVGNFPSLERGKIDKLIEILNNAPI